MKAVKLVALILVILLVAGYFIASAVIRGKVEAALRGLPASLQVSYTRITPRLLHGEVAIEGLGIRFPADAPARSVKIARVSADGIGFWTLLRRKRLTVSGLRLERCSIELDDQFADRHFPLPKAAMPFDSIWIGKAVCHDLRVTTPNESLSMDGDLELDAISKGRGDWDATGIHVT